MDITAFNCHYISLPEYEGIYIYIYIYMQGYQYCTLSEKGQHNNSKPSELRVLSSMCSVVT